MAGKRNAATVRSGGELVTLDGERPELDPRAPIPVEQVTDPGELEDETPDDEALARVLDELGDASEGASVKVYRVNDRRKESFVFECKPHQFSLTELQENYGGGEYSVRVYGSGGLIARKRLTIEEPRNKKIEVSSGPSVIEQLKPFLENQQRMIEALAARQNGPATDIVSLIAALGKLDEMRGARTAQPSYVSDPFMLMDRMAGFVGKLRAAETGQPVGSSTLDLFRDIAQQVLPLIVNRPQAPALTAPPAQAVESPQPQTDPSAPTPAPNAIELSPEDEMRVMYSMFLRQLVAQAERNANVIECADGILDMAEPETLEALLSAPDWVRTLSAINPGVTKYRAWFERLRDEILKQIAADREPETGSNDSAPSANNLTSQ